VHIVVAACAPTPLRAKKAEALLKGTSLKKSDIERAMDAASKEIFPIDDVRGCARYRREMTAVSLKRAIEKAMAEGSN
jgi:CO/xanthine dehydrogenase FAD-binding subunit